MTEFEANKAKQVLSNKMNLYKSGLRWVHDAQRPMLPDHEPAQVVPQLPKTMPADHIAKEHIARTRVAQDVHTKLVEGGMDHPFRPPRRVQFDDKRRPAVLLPFSYITWARNWRTKVCGLGWGLPLPATPMPAGRP